MENKLNVQLSGKIYEYFIGRDESAISELGAYFTDRHITRYIYNNLLKPELDENDDVYSMIDMFGGSGGFTVGYIDYIMNKLKLKVNWKDNINKVYHFDMNEDVIKSAGLEFNRMISTNTLTYLRTSRITKINFQIKRNVLTNKSP